MRRIMRCNGVPLIVALFVSVVGSATTVNAAGRVLHGSYALTTARSCTVANLPFGVNLEIPGGVFRLQSVDAGTLTFKPDGTGTSVSSSKTMNVSNTTAGALILSISEVSGPFTYTVNADNEVVVTFGVLTFQTTVGAGVGNTGTVTFSVPARFQLAGGRTTLLRAPATEMAQEVLNFIPPIGAPFTQYRICTRSTTATRLP